MANPSEARISMPAPNEAKKFSPIADTGGIQDEFDVDKFVEAGIKEMTLEEAAHEYLVTKALSERHAKNILRLDNEIAAAGRFGENIDEEYFNDPSRMPGWEKLGDSEHEGISGFVKLVKERDRLLNEQGFLLQNENAMLDQLKKQEKLSGEDLSYELNKHGVSEISEEEMNETAEELEKVMSKKTGLKAA